MIVKNEQTITPNRRDDSFYIPMRRLERLASGRGRAWSAQVLQWVVEFEFRLRLQWDYVTYAEGMCMRPQDTSLWETRTG